MLGTTVLVQALAVGVLGALIGVVFSLATWAAAFGVPDATTLTATLLVAVGAACLLTALIPAAWAGRLPTARILSAD